MGCRKQLKVDCIQFCAMVTRLPQQSAMYKLLCFIYAHFAIHFMLIRLPHDKNICIHYIKNLFIYDQNL